MTENQHPDPFTEASQLAFKDFQRMFYTAAALTNAYLQHRAKAEQRKMLDGRRERRAMEERERAERDAVRARWEPATDRQWLRSAGPVDVANVWTAAVQYADPASDLYERSAELAVDNCEDRLRELHPYAMSRYDRLRTDGMSRLEAMHEAAPLFLNHPNARPHGASPRPGIAAQGLGHPWIDEMHGPSREGFDQHVAEQQTARGTRIVEGMQSRALASDRPLLDPDEQRTALEAATNLPPEIIAQVVPPTAPAPRRSPRPWENESPFSIEEVVAFAAAHPDRLVGPDPAQRPAPQPGQSRHA